MSKKRKQSHPRSRQIKNKSARSFGGVLQQALAYHQAGNLRQAEALYRQILLAEPSHPEALNFLGMLAHQAGKSDAGAELVRQAIRCRPDYVDAYGNLGFIFHDQGKLDEAVASFRRALALRPEYAEMHSNLGNALQAQGKLDEAIASFRRALALQPEYAEMHYNLGNALKDSGRLDEAVESFCRAVALHPDYAEAHNNLGVTLREQGKPEEAVASYQRALALQPKYAEAHNNLGVALQDQGKPEEAVACYQRALAWQPGFAEPYHNLGAVFRELGAMDEAVASYRKALELKPRYAAAYKDLSLIVHHTEVDAEVRAMEDLYHNGELSRTDRLNLGFALGKTFEDLREYGKAFDFILEANRLKRKTIQYSIQEERKFFERLKSTFSSDFFASCPGSSHHDPAPIFIIGMPRSGTSLVEQILASHPQVFGAGELVILQKMAKELVAGDAEPFPECLLQLDCDAFQKMGSEYLAKMREHADSSPYVTDKMPHNFLHVGFIKKILPGAKIIHCLRDPMDTCLSIFKNDFMGTHGYAYDLIELGRYYGLYRSLMAHWEGALPGLMCTVRYEEVVADQKKQTSRMLDFCGLPWSDSCLAFHKTRRRVSTSSLAQVRRPLYKDSVRLWKRYEKQLEPLRNALCEASPEDIKEP